MFYNVTLHVIAGRIGRWCILPATILLIITLSWSEPAQAQEVGDWSPPYRLSTDRGKAGEAYMVADQYGYVHTFWTEELPDTRTLLQYARFDGETWTTPNDIRITAPFTPIKNVSPFVDNQGTLHVAWAESDSGPLYYTSAPAHNALSAHNWERLRRITVPGNRVLMKVDSKGTIHLLYIKFLGEEQGIYYTQLLEDRMTWTEPVWLDPDILFDHVPRSLHFDLDEDDGLHAAWYYSPRNEGGGDWVRYVRSLDGGRSWSLPVTIDRNDGPEAKLRAAGPVMAIQGRSVHIVWAVDTGSFIYRNHRYSSDAGATWSDASRIFGNLNGQAFDGLTVDPLGRVHFVGDLRFPQGIYHAYWEQDHWTTPALLYLIRNNSSDPLGDRVHAHDVRAVVRGGNQLVVTFADPPPDPSRRLFVMFRTLQDTPALPAVPTPTAVPTLTPLAVTATQPPPDPTPTATRPIIGNAPPATNNWTATTQNVMWFGVIPPLLLFGFAALWLVFKRR